MAFASITKSIQATEAPSYAVLLRQSLANAPALLEQAAHVRAAAADAQQSQAWLNPSFDAEFENLSAPKSGGVSQRQDTYTLTQPFEIGGKRAARVEAGERSLDVAEARHRQVRIAFAANLAIAYATAAAMQERQALASEDLARANDDLRAAKAWVKAGKEANLRLAQAQTGVATAQAAEQAAIANTTEALEQLSALVGAKAPYTQVDRTLLTSVFQLAIAESLSNDEAPTVATAAAERDALNALVRVEQKKQIPDIGLGAGLRHFGWADEAAFVVSVSAKIPIFDRNSGGITAARERAIAADTRLETARLEAGAARRAALAQVKVSEGRLNAAVQGESAATEAYRLGRIGYDAGKTSLVELLAIRRALSDAKALTINTRLARIYALAALSQANGRIPFGG
ncbi:TolC family protein [Azomonas macrocytogenes]|uniref:Cobalt-zinc-cadmium efflux system outer membrane protein n=1 Tax=Azomonas macrocytogenes TaxID=69962 RepID=A0A839TAA0_AZOMA|nr:TolC family protein [Azomonas macrocytogenes]MBB3105084.1 cobalt-zinc-cadmium efflux system outer membrane protein [Azomonas macrocytogenes]